MKMRPFQSSGSMPFWFFTATLFFSLLLSGHTAAEEPQTPLGVKTPKTKRIAVIGAGSAGASTAYYLRNYADFFSVPINITVFERTDHVGGRSTTVNAFEDPSQPVELGASIFVEVNKNLMRAAKRFNLKIKDAGSDAPKEAENSLGVWDGSKFAFLQSNSSFRWWNVFKFLWKYGWSPMRTQSLMKTTVNKFLKMYKWPYFPFKSLSEVTMSTGLVEATWATGAEFLKDNKISEEFSREVIQASTRVNYGQNLPLIHGLESMVCMATDGAVSIEGGNWQIFQKMLESSKATLQLGSQVADIRRNSNDTHTLAYSSSDGQPHDAVFDQVVIASPLQFSNLTITPSLQHAPDKIPYVHLHVTIFASPHKLSPRFFKLSPKSSVPEVVLTTLPEGTNLGARRDGVGPAGFWSISTLRKTRVPVSHQTANGPKEHYVYKIFSPKRLTVGFLSKLLGVDMSLATEYSSRGVNETIAAMSTSAISWYEEKVWRSYPYMYPRVTFEKFGLAPNLWYTSGIESFISTMETSSLAGMNVAALMMSEWIRGFESKMKTYEQMSPEY